MDRHRNPDRTDLLLHHDAVTQGFAALATGLLILLLDHNITDQTKALGYIKDLAIQTLANDRGASHIPYISGICR
jgi:hypothetical protein